MSRTIQGTTARCVLSAVGGFAMALLCGAASAGAQPVQSVEEPASAPASTHLTLGQGTAGASSRSPFRLPAFVQPVARLDSEVWANPTGGLRRGWAYTGALLLGVGFDLSRWVSGLSSGIAGLWLQGSSLSSQVVGDAGGVSNVAGLATVRLFRLWVEWQAPHSDWSVKAGQLAIDDDFMVLPSAQLFSNSGFGTPQTFALNVPAPIYPLGALGARLEFIPHNRWTVRLGLYDLDAGSERTSRYSADYRLSSAQGALVLAEVIWLPESDTRFAVGGFHAAAPERELRGEDQPSRRMSQLYAMVDYALADVGESRVRWFGHAALAVPVRRAVAVRQLDAGITVSGGLWSRPEDCLGLGVVRVDFGQKYLSVGAQRGRWAPTEWVGELTYAYRWRSSVQLQPTLQWVGDPHFSRRDSLVVGVRLSIER